MDGDKVAGLVIAAIANQTGSNAADLKLDQELVNDLGLDSIDAVELLVILERQAGVILEIDNQVENLVTIGDVVAWLIAEVPSVLA